MEEVPNSKLHRLKRLQWPICLLKPTIYLSARAPPALHSLNSFGKCVTGGRRIGAHPASQGPFLPHQHRGRLCGFWGLGEMGGKRQLFPKKMDGFSAVNMAEVSLSFCLGTILSSPPAFCRPWKQWVEVFQTLPSSLEQQAEEVGRAWQGHPPAGVL